MSTRMHQQIKQAVASGLFASLLCAHGIVGAVTEAEPNDTQATAQVLTMSATGATVSATIGTVSGGMTTDLDLYAFSARTGDVPVITVVSDGAWDTLVGLYDSSGNLLEMNDDAYPMNPDSTSPYDSRIDTFRIDADDTYYVAVTPIPRYLGTNYSVINPSSTIGGRYELTIEGVTPAQPVSTLPPTSDPSPVHDPSPVPDPSPVSDPSPAPVDEPVIVVTPEGNEARVISIAVRHWAREDDEPENRRHRNLIAVAIMSSPDFAATKVNKDSLKFGATGTERSIARCRKHGKDVNRDGLKDMVCYFKSDLAGFGVGDVQAFLNGTGEDGQAITGSAALKVFSISKEKRQSWHERHKVDPRGKHRGQKKSRNNRNNR